MGWVSLNEDLATAKEQARHLTESLANVANLALLASRQKSIISWRLNLSEKIAEIENKLEVFTELATHPDFLLAEKLIDKQREFLSVFAWFQKLLKINETLSKRISKLENRYAKSIKIHEKKHRNYLKNLESCADRNRKYKDRIDALELTISEMKRENTNLKSRIILNDEADFFSAVKRL